jgi:hypothetical protein
MTPVFDAAYWSQLNRGEPEQTECEFCHGEFTQADGCIKEMNDSYPCSAERIAYLHAESIMSEAEAVSLLTGGGWEREFTATQAREFLLLQL